MRSPLRKDVARTRELGFSLLEMTIAILIAGIIAAIAVPKYTSSLYRYRTQVAAQRLAQDIELCRRHARFTAQDVTLTISFAKNLYRISPLDSPLRPGTLYEVSLGAGPSSPVLGSVNNPTVGEVSLDGTVQVLAIGKNTDITIVFDRYGVPNKKAEIMISCGDSSGVVRLSAEGVVTRS